MIISAAKAMFIIVAFMSGILAGGSAMAQGAPEPRAASSCIGQDTVYASGPFKLTFKAWTLDRLLNGTLEYVPRRAGLGRFELRIGPDGTVQQWAFIIEDEQCASIRVCDFRGPVRLPTPQTAMEPPQTMILVGLRDDIARRLKNTGWPRRALPGKDWAFQSCGPLGASHRIAR